VEAQGDAPTQNGIWGPAWAYDPEDQLCYLTGGATSPGDGNMSSVYVYDPIQNLWLDQLPDFDTQRNFHAAFVLDQGGKQLCVVGGVNHSAELSSTQCYDLTTGTWGPENDDLGPLPSEWWGMGYSDKLHLGTNHQLWLTAGVSDTVITDETLYYDVLSGAWLSGGALPSGAVYRGSATTMNNEIYHIGGASSGFEFVGWSDRHVQCLMCAEAGILQGYVLDAENAGNPTCTPAAVHVEPLNYDVAAGPDGFYQTHLISGTYGVSATAPGYSVEGPVPAEVMQGMTTTVDFVLSRPVVDIEPQGFVSITVAISREWAVALTIHNLGGLPLDFDITEAGGDIPWVWTSPMTGTVAAGSSAAVDVTFFCTEQGEHAGTLVLGNGDPCRASLDVPLLILCQDVVPTYFPIVFRN
jgi:hypothetical protein